MKIKVTSSFFDVEFGKDISPETIKESLMSESEIKRIVSVLEKSNIFMEAVVNLRKKYKVPEHFYDFKELEIIDKNDRKRSDRLVLEIKELTKKLEIPSYFGLSVWFFIMCDLFLIPQRIPIDIHYIDKKGFVNDKKFLKLMLSDNAEDGSVFIEIKEQMSREKLHNLIDEKWDDIESGMKLNLYKRPINRMIRTDLAKRITELRDRDIKKMPFSKIVDILQGENPDVDLYNNLSEDYAKILYYRWNKKTKPQK